MTMQTFSVYFVNFGYAAQETHSTVEAALAHAKAACFESAIYAHVSDTGRHLVAAWSPISGTRWYDRAYQAEAVR